jgi:hypothetical protein
MRRALSMDCGVWVPALAEPVLGRREAPIRVLGRDDSGGGARARHRLAAAAGVPQGGEGVWVRVASTRCSY